LKTTYNSPRVRVSKWSSQIFATLDNKSIFKNLNNVACAVAVPLVVIALAGTMNNGTALTSSAFDTVVLWLTDLAHSTFTLMLALIVLVIAGWQIAHGGGYKMLGLVLAVLAIMILGPTFLTTMATAMPPL
jgi:uncharacterized membrane protein YagU involved in acid resistance